MPVDTYRANPQTTAAAALWSPTGNLSPRVRRLRDQYWAFYQRDYTNEVRAYSAGTPYDQVYAPWSWTNRHIRTCCTSLDG